MGRHSYPTRILVDSSGQKCGAFDKGARTSCNIAHPCRRAAPSNVARIFALGGVRPRSTVERWACPKAARLLL
uniref:Uncharacterized protein n=1 Tax=Oryza glaberrima TaxID=4538 RepID=I1QHM3_ORYGL